MMIKVFFNFILSAKSPRGKEKIIRRLYRKLVEIYDDSAVNNTKDAEFEVTIKFVSWEESIFNIITDVERLGYELTLTGDIEHYCNLQINEPSIVGVSSINIIIKNEIEKVS